MFHKSCSHKFSIALIWFYSQLDHTSALKDCTIKFPTYFNCGRLIAVNYVPSPFRRFPVKCVYISIDKGFSVCYRTKYKMNKIHSGGSEIKFTFQEMICLLCRTSVTFLLQSCIINLLNWCDWPGILVDFQFCYQSHFKSSSHNFERERNCGFCNYL
jgi:hypothetical protein